MKIQRYNAEDMSLAEDISSSLDFGTVYQGNYCEEAIVVRPSSTTESVLNEMKLFLESKGPYTKSSFGVGKSVIPITGVKPSEGILSDTLTEVNNTVLSNSLGVSLEDGEYVWLDLKVGETEKGSYSGINYRFVFDYA